MQQAEAATSTPDDVMSAGKSEENSRAPWEAARVRLVYDQSQDGPSILSAMTEGDADKLDEITDRIDHLRQMVFFAIDGAQSCDWDPRRQVRALGAALRHIETSLSDIAAISGGCVRREQVA